LYLSSPSLSGTPVDAVFPERKSVVVYTFIVDSISLVVNISPDLPSGKIRALCSCRFFSQDQAFGEVPKFERMKDLIFIFLPM
jgi:hypothetical protein